MENDFIDVNYTEDKQINGAPKYYSTKDVAEKLSESDSTIRYWCNQFENKLNIERSGRDRKFTEHNIEQLRYIQKLLRYEGFTIRQVNEILEEKIKDLIPNEENKNTQFMLEAISKALTTNIESLLVDIQDNFNKTIINQNEIINQLKLDLSNKIEESNKLIKEYSTLIQQKSEERDLKLVETLKQLQEDKKSENKNFFSKLFKK